MPRIIPKMREMMEENMRAEILRAGNEILIEEGLDGVTLEKIATKLSVARSTIYNYFEDKEDILETLIEHIFINHFKVLDALCLAPGSATHRLEQIALYVINDFNRHKQLHEGLLKRKRPPIKLLDFRSYHIQNLHKIANVISHGIKEKEFASMDAMLGAALFNGAIRELSFDIALGVINTPIDRLVKQLMKQLLKGFKYQTPPTKKDK